MIVTLIWWIIWISASKNVWESIVFVHILNTCSILNHRYNIRTVSCDFCPKQKPICYLDQLFEWSLLPIPPKHKSCILNNQKYLVRGDGSKDLNRSAQISENLDQIWIGQIEDEIKEKYDKTMPIIWARSGYILFVLEQYDVESPCDGVDEINTVKETKKMSVRIISSKLKLIWAG